LICGKAKKRQLEREQTAVNTAVNINWNYATSVEKKLRGDHSIL
jgi:hypothetical protein